MKKFLAKTSLPVVALLASALPALPSVIVQINTFSASGSSYSNTGSNFTLVIDFTAITLDSHALTGLNDTLTVTGTIGGTATYDFSGALNGSLSNVSATNWLSWTGNVTESGGTNANPVLAFGAATTNASYGANLASDLGLIAGPVTSIQGGATVVSSPSVLSGTFSGQLPTAAPEPASFALFGTGLVACGLMSKKLRRRSAPAQTPVD